MPPINFFVPGTPAPQGSKQAYVRGGRAILVESSRKVPAWRHAVTTAAKAATPQPIPGPIRAEIVFIMPRTKAMKNNPAPPMIQRPDGDKLLRATLDGLTGTAIIDDSHVTECEYKKRRAEYGEQTGAHITITPL